MSIKALAEAIAQSFKETFTVLNPLPVTGGGGGGGGDGGTEYPEGSSTSPSFGSVLLFRRADGTLKALQGDNSDRIKVDIGTLTISSVEVSNFPATQLVSGTVVVSNFPTTQPVSGTVVVSNFPTTQPVSGTVAVSNFPATQNVNQSANATTTTATFTSSTTSSTFTIANRLSLITCPAITGAPTLTLQVSLDSGTTWVSTSVTLASSATLPRAIEADSLAKVSGAFGLSNAFRFSSSASITSAILNIRSITQ